MFKKNVFVTGASGFIGSNLIKYLKYNTNINVKGISLGCNMEINRILYTDYNDVKWLKKKIENMNNVIVIHTAAHIPKSNKEYMSSKTLDINKKINDFITEVFNEIPVEKFIYFSSISVYGYGYKDLIGVTEDSELLIENSYAESKLYGEEKTLNNFNNCYILRLSAPYGHNKKRKSVLENMIEQALRDEEIAIYGEGNRTQDYIYIYDIWRVIYKLIHENIKVGVYNLASGHSCKMIDLAKTILNVLNSRSQIKFINKRESSSVSIRNDKLAKFLNMQFINIEEGLKRMYSSNYIKRL